MYEKSITAHAYVYSEFEVAWCDTTLQRTDFFCLIRTMAMFGV